MRAAHLGRRTLVLTIDPSQRLAAALGFARAELQEVEVPVRTGSGRLLASKIDAPRIFSSFLHKHMADTELLKRLERNRLYQQLVGQLSGAQEFTALEYLLSCSERPDLDLVILDTPPAEHALEFLSAPEIVRQLFDESVVRWFATRPEERNGFLANLLHKGTQLALRSLQTVTGESFIRELTDFFISVRGVQAAIRARTLAIETLLQGPETALLMVTSFDELKLREADYLNRSLLQRGYRTEAVVLNRAFPFRVPLQPGASPSANYQEAWEFYQTFCQFQQRQHLAYEQFCRLLPSDVTILRVPEYNRDIYGIEDLEQLADALAKLA